jgi:hypothetical protein
VVIRAPTSFSRRFTSRLATERRRRR